MSDIVIKIENLSKYYKLGVINNGTLYKDLQTWIARKTGKVDPHSKIGQDRFATTAEGFWALKDLNLDIKQGDRVGIIGKNGAGKSTLLKLLSRITAPTEGSIKMKGRVASLLEVGTGFNGELTGRENIYLNGAILGMKRREVDRKIDEIIAFSEIEKHIDTPVKRYSSGMYVRLAFAVAAHLDSEILIADEVLAVGDANFQKKALGKMNELSTGEGRTVLFVSHNMASVKALCNKGIVLEQGSVVRQDNDIIDSINWYSRNDYDFRKFSYSWNLSESNLKTKYFEPIELSIQDAKGNVVNNTLFSDEKYFINLKFNILKWKENLYFMLRFFDQNSNCVFSSSPFDYNTKYALEEKECKLNFQIPVQELSTGDYLVELRASLYGEELLFDKEKNGPYLKISVVNKEISGRYTSTLIGLIGGKNAWSFKEVSF